MWDIVKSAAVWLAVCVALVLWLGVGKPANVVALFVVSGLAVGSLYALGGIGIVLLYRATGVLNLAAGAIGMVGVMLAWQLVQIGAPAPLAWIGGILISMCLALAYGRFIAPSMEYRDPVVKSVATLGYALALLGVVSFFFSDDPRKFSLPTDHMAVTILGLRVTVTRLLVIALALVLVIGVTLALNRTRIGLQMRALANNRRLSAMIGIPILKVEIVAWGLAGLLFGLTGLFFGDLVRLEPTVITFIVIPSVAAAIAGRLDSLPDVLMGGFAMGVVESMLTLSPELKNVRPIAPFVIAALVLLVMNRRRSFSLSGAD